MYKTCEDKAATVAFKCPRQDKRLQESYEDVYEMILSSSADSEQEQHVNCECVCVCACLLTPLLARVSSHFPL